MNATANFIESLPDFAKDVRINASNVLTPDGAPGLSPSQLEGVILASAYATREPATARWAEARASEKLSPEYVSAAKAAASVMAMNNVYYRFLHLVEDADYSAMPAKLRMTVIGNPGIDKIDFELYSLAVSAINGCGACVASHARKAAGEGVSKEAVQSTARVAAVINSIAQARFASQIEKEVA